MQPIQITLKNPIQATITLIAKEALNGDIMIYDHPEMNVIFSPGKKVVTLLPKTSYSDRVFNTQKRFIDYLIAKGIAEPKSIRSGSAFYTLECQLFDSKDKNVSPTDVFLYLTAKFLKEEEPLYNAINYYDTEVDEMFLNPDEDNSTELGEFGHEIDNQVDQYTNVGSTSLRYMYEGLC